MRKANWPVEDHNIVERSLVEGRLGAAQLAPESAAVQQIARNPNETSYIREETFLCRAA